MLPLIDDLERALAATPASDTAAPVAGYRAGVELIHRQLLELLRKRKVTPIEALGADFDPHVHQAVTPGALVDASRWRGDRGAAPGLHAGRPAAASGDGEGGLA